MPTVGNMRIISMYVRKLGDREWTWGSKERRGAFLAPGCPLSLRGFPSLPPFLPPASVFTLFTLFRATKKTQMARKEQPDRAPGGHLPEIHVVSARYVG